MKKILVFSDSHGYKKAVDKLFSKIDEFDYVYYLGDGYGDVADYLDIYPNKVEAVLGNCDHYFDAPSIIINKVENVNILLTHGKEQYVKDTYDYLAYVAKKKDVQLALFGHTHFPFDEYVDDVRLINPGALGSDYYKGTYSILTINGENVINERRSVSDLMNE